MELSKKVLSDSYTSKRTLKDFLLAEEVGFEPTCRLLTGNPISSRARYGRFATPPAN